MEQQKKDLSGIKTHEEIIELFKSLESMEEKIKNPELLVDGLFDEESMLQEVEHPSEVPPAGRTEPQPIQPVGEIPSTKPQKRKRLSVVKHQQGELATEKKIKRVPFWRKEHLGELEPDASTELPPQNALKIPRATFVLHYDENGTLVGLPIKKEKPIKQKKRWFGVRKKEQTETEEHEEEPIKGIKGKLKRVTSKLRRKKSSEGEESSGGIGGKVKGLFRRKPKE